MKKNLIIENLMNAVSELMDLGGDWNNYFDLETFENCLQLLNGKDYQEQHQKVIDFGIDVCGFTWNEGTNEWSDIQ